MAWCSLCAHCSLLSLLCAEPLRVLCRDPQDPPDLGQRVGMERVCQEHPCCRDCRALAFPAQALPRPSSTSRCPRGRATSALAPLDPHMAKILGVSS